MRDYNRQRCEVFRIFVYINMGPVCNFFKVSHCFISIDKDGVRMQVSCRFISIDKDGARTASLSSIHFDRQRCGITIDKDAKYFTSLSIDRSRWGLYVIFSVSSRVSRRFISITITIQIKESLLNFK